MENFTKASRTQCISGIWRKIGRAMLGLAIVFAFANTAVAQTVYLTTGITAGSFASEKWVTITTGVDGTGTEIWRQGTGAYGNGAGLLTDQAIDVTAYCGTTIYLNAYDEYGDSWDGHTYELRTAAGGGGTLIINNGGVSPNGPGFGGGFAWDFPPPATGELETSEAFSTACPPGCTGTPNNGVAAIDLTSGCDGVNLSLTSTGLSSGVGISYNWQESTDNVTFTNISGATSANYTATSVAGTTYYRQCTYCSNSGIYAYSPSVNYVGVSCASLVVPYTGNSTNACGQSAVITDHAGATVNYNSNADGYLVLQNTPGSFITLTGTHDTESGWDYLYIYDGAGTGGTLLNTYTGGPGNITTINGTDGQILTVQFQSDASFNDVGFELTALYSGTCALCSGTPAGGTAAIGDASGCAVAPLALSATGFETVNIDYQWQVSNDNFVSDINDIGGATNTTYNGTTPAGAGVTYYRLKSTCTDSGLSGFSTVVTYTSVLCGAFDLPGVSGSSNTLTCGTNTWLYDDAGGATNYLNSFDSYTVLDASGTAQISLSGNYQVENGWDYIYIYYGSGTGGTQVPGSPFTGAGSIDITGNVGEPLTVRLDSDASINDVGFAFQTLYSGTCASCTGAPANGTVSIPSTSGCSGSAMTLTTSGLDVSVDITYQWQVSNDNFVSDINDVTGETSATYNLTTATGTNYYRIASTCSAGPTTSYSNIVSFNGFSCTPISTPTSGFNTVTCGVTSNLTDDGGLASNYSNGADGYTVFESSGTAQITFSGTYDVESGWDYLRIYEGVGTGGTLAYSYTGAGNITPFVSLPGQSITVRFDADASVNDVGFDILAVYSGVCDPCSAAPSVIAATNVDNNSADINWTAAATTPGVGYNWEIRTSGAGGSGIGGLAASGSTNNSTFTAPSGVLTGNTTYYVYARSECTAGTDYSSWNGPVSFTTECDPDVAPTTEEPFDSYTGSAPDPACWYEVNNTVIPASAAAVTPGNGAWVSTTGFANTGSDAGAKINLWGTTDEDWIVSQPIDLGAVPSTFRVSFNMAVTNYNSAVIAASLGTHEMYLVMSLDGGATWDVANVIHTFTGAGSYGVQEFAVNLTQTGIVRFALVANENGTSPDVDFHIDDFVVEIIPTCFVPTVGAATNITNSSATLNWAVASPIPTNYEWEVRTSGAGGSGAVGLVEAGTTVDGTIITANTSVTLTGQTTYYVYARSFCGGSDYSLWNGPISFTTECDPETAPTVNETFNGFVSNPASPFEPLTCWSEGNGAIGTPSALVTGNSSWVATSGFGNAGSNPGAKQNLWGSDVGDWLISQPIDLGATPGVYRVSYRYSVTNYNSAVVAASLGTHETNVMVSTDGGITWNAADIIYTHTGAGAYAANTYTHDLTTQTGIIKIAFVNVEGGFSPDVDCHIDDFIVEAIPPCAEPGGALTTLVTDQTGTINWVEPGTLPAVGYMWEIRTSGAGGSGIGGLAASGSVAVGTDFAAITGLTATTTYTVYVRSECTAGTQFSAWATVDVFTTECAPEVAPTVVETFDTYLGNAPGPVCWTEGTGTIGTPSTVTIANSLWVYGTSTPGDPGDFSPAINLWGTTNDWLISHPIDLGVTPGDYRVSFDIKLTTYASPFGAFQTDMGSHEVSLIVSQDGGATWNAADVIATYTGTGTYDGTTVTIDLTAYSGVVKFAFVSNTTVTSPDLYFWIDDFLVEDIPTCFIPTALTTANITIDGVDVSWTAPTLGTPIGYEYEISTSATPGTGTPVAGTSVTGITGLSSGTLYYLHVRTDCGLGDFSAWTSTTFTTIYENPFCDPIGVTIPDNGCSVTYLEQQIFVSGFTDVLGPSLIINKCAINIAHTYDADLRIILVSPLGTEVMLSEFNGGSGNNYGGLGCNTSPTVFKMDATTAVTAGSAPFSGDYIPEGDFADFDGEDPNGLWTLKICDDFAFDTGVLNYFRLQIIPPPTCFAPTGLASSGITGTNALITWLAGTGSPGPSSYQFYYNTTGVAPDEFTTPTGPATGLSVFLNTLTPSTYYYIWVRSDCGLQQSDWSAVHEFNTVPPNDDCTGATPIVCGGSYNDDSSVATAEVIPGSTGSTGVGLWYSFIGTGGDVTFSTCATGNTYDTEINVLTGTCGSFTSVGSNDDNCGGGGNFGSSLTIATTAGTEYFVYVSGWTSTYPGGAYTLDVSCGGYWTGTISTDWVNAGNWSNGAVPGSVDNAVIPTSPSGGNFPNVAGAAVANDLIVQPGATIDIADGGSVTVAGDLTLDGIINVPNNGSLVQETGSGLSGSGHVNVTKNGSSVYDYWSSPIVNGSLGAYWGFNSANSTIDPSDDENDPGWFQTGGPIPTSEGGAFYAAGTRTFSGTPNNGSLPIAITDNAPPADDWDLLGNPYPSGVSILSFLSGNSAITGGLAFWDESDYATHNGLVGSAGGGGNTPNGTIGTCQGFMAKAAVGGGTVTFTNAMRVASNDAMLFRPAQLQTLHVSVTNTENLYNQATFGFYDDAVDGLDQYDTPKLNSLADLSFFSYIGADPFAINFYSPLVADTEIPLGLNSNMSTMVNFTLDDFDNLDNDDIVLEDRYLNVFTDLKQGDYNFAASAQLYTDRFFLHFNPSSVTGIEEVTNAGMNAFMIEEMLNVYSVEDIVGNLEILDMSGKVVMTREKMSVGPNGIQLSLSALSDGVYIVRVVGEDVNMSQKILK